MTMRHAGQSPTRPSPAMRERVPSAARRVRARARAIATACFFVAPAKASAHVSASSPLKAWIPAAAGMTEAADGP